MPLLRTPSARAFPPRLLALLALLFGACDASSPGPAPAPAGEPPFSPDEALATFEIVNGFRIELVAAEPLVTDPVAMEIDEEGRIYVVEMPGYPLDKGGTGRVKLLQDTDGDGRPDAATLFADSLTLPTGILRWKDGVLVTDAPDVLYFEDTDGDGRADLRRVVLTGFALSNPQANVNKPLYGLDNWIYLANNGPIWWTKAHAEQFGDRGDEIYFPDRPDAPRLGRNGLDRNVRFKPDAFALEALSGDSQFGQTFDAWGHHFLVDNSHHQYHEVIAASYFERNPDLPIRRATHDTPDHGNAAVVYPITVNPENQLLTDRGVFTSACGITAYLGGAFPPPYDRDAVFVAEPVHNLVHVDKVTDDGATFTASRLLEGREFLASTDSWFRPVNFTVGPDGALYLVDYYRQIVEHPEWMDDATAASGHLNNGTDLGRIWRIAPDDLGPLAWYGRIALGEAATATLVDSLESTNAWWRMHAQRLLMDRRDEAAVAPLTRLVRESRSAEARVHALWTLDGLGRLDAALLETALHDEAAGVRENAIRLAERYLPETPSLAAPLLPMADDPHPKVRFQLLNTLGGLDTDAAHTAQRRLLFNDIEDPWTQIAALLALPASRPDLFEAAVADLGGQETDGRKAYLERIAAIIGAGGDASALRAVLATASAETAPEASWWRAAGLTGLATGMQRREAAPPGLSAERERLVDAYFDGDAAVRIAVLDLFEHLGLPTGNALTTAVERAATLAADTTADPDRRAGALRLVALAGADDHLALFKQTIEAQAPAAMQRAAVRALGRAGGTEPATYLLDTWHTLTPELRDEAVNVFMTEERASLLLDAVEADVVQPATIGWERRVVLMRDTEEPIRSRARSLLSVEEPSPEALLERYQTALAQDGNADRGEATFTRVCGPCHQSGAIGEATFGPDLATVRHWPRQALLAKILDPNRSVAVGYEFWTVARESGGTAAGVITDETPTSITVRNQADVQTIPRTDIASITAATTSAMPPGLTAQIDERQMADLLAFLKRTAAR